MKKTSFRYLSLLVALIMSLSMASSLAESPMMPKIPSIEGTLRMEMGIKVAPGLIQMVAGLAGIADEATMSSVNTVISAINKMKTTLLMAKDGMSATIGTDAGQLIDLQATFNQETMDNLITTSLMPGIALSLDPAMIKTLTAQQGHPEITQEMIDQVTAPYLEVLLVAYADLFSAQTAQEGSFETAQYGTFTQKTPINITTYKMANLIEGLAGVYKNDAILKLHLEKAATTSEGEIPDVNAELEKTVSEIKSEPDTVILSGTMYENSSARYFDVATPDDSSEPLKIDIKLSKPDAVSPDGNVKIEGKVVAKSVSEDEPATVGPIDWANIEKSIENGENFKDILITFDMETTTAQQIKSSQTKLNLKTSGLSLGLAVSGSLNMETLENDMMLQLSFITPEPSLTFWLKTSKTDELPLAPELSTSTKVLLNQETMTDETEKLLETNLKAALPLLLSRLTAAFPEEGAELVKMLQELMAPKPVTEPIAPVENNPIDPGESLPAPTVDPMPEPAPVTP